MAKATKKKTDDKINLDTILFMKKRGIMSYSNEETLLMVAEDSAPYGR